MIEVSYEYDIPSPGRDHKGFTQTLREMRKGGSVEVPMAKKPSLYSAAKAAGADLSEFDIDYMVRQQEALYLELLKKKNLIC